MGEEQERKLFVRGLNKSTNEEGLKRFFETYGNVVDCNIMRDQEKRSRGFGFILFDDVAAVDKIIVAKKEGSVFSLDEHTVEVKRALPKIPRGSGAGAPRSDIIHRKVFVGGLPSTITESDVRGYFETFGRVNEIQLIKDRETGRPRGFAFLTFDEEDSADKCLQRRTHEICRKICEVKRAQARTKEERTNGAADKKQDSDPTHLRTQEGGIQETASGSGGLGASDVNRLIQQAFAMGQGLYQQPSAQPPPLPALSHPDPSANIILQALTGQMTSPVVAPVPVATTSSPTLTQLTQLLHAGGLDASTLGALLKGVAQPQAPSPQVGGGQIPATSMDVYSNTNSYPNYGSKSPTYKTGKEELMEKRQKRAYRPY